MTWLTTAFEHLAEWILRPFLLLIYVLFRKKLPVTWANRKWYEFLGVLNAGSKIKRSSKDWSDYALLPNGDTANMLKSESSNSDLRQRLNSQIMDLFLQSQPPNTSAKPICIITSGGTASGKTSAVDLITSQLFQKTGMSFLRIDYDIIKRALPEYPLMLELKIKDAAKYVQSESIKIGGKLFKKAYKMGFNIIYEKTLDDARRASEDIRELKKKNYDIVIIGTHITEAEGQARAAQRYERAGRYIPPEIIQKLYSGVPKTLFEIRHRVDNIFLFDNRSPSLNLMFYKDENGPQVTNQDLYDKYLNVVGGQYDLRI